MRINGYFHNITNVDNPHQSQYHDEWETFPSISTEVNNGIRISPTFSSNTTVQLLAPERGEVENDGRKKGKL